MIEIRDFENRCRKIRPSAIGWPRPRLSAFDPRRLTAMHAWGKKAVHPAGSAGILGRRVGIAFRRNPTRICVIGSRGVSCGQSHIDYTVVLRKNQPVFPFEPYRIDKCNTYMKKCQFPFTVQFVKIITNKDLLLPCADFSQKRGTLHGGRKRPSAEYGGRKKPTREQAAKPPLLKAKRKRPTICSL